MLKRVMRSECVSCVPRVFLHVIVVYVACGTEILDVLPDQDKTWDETLVTFLILGL